MSVDRANRSLAAMLALAGALSSVVALVGCCAFGALTYRVRTGGIVSLSTTGTQATLNGTAPSGTLVVRRRA